MIKELLVNSYNADGIKNRKLGDSIKIIKTDSRSQNNKGLSILDIEHLNLKYNHSP
jgi:hypothetical protein